MSALTTKSTYLSVETEILGLLAQFGVPVLDQDAQDLWVLLEHGMVLSGRCGRDGRGLVEWWCSGVNRAAQLTRVTYGAP